MVNYLQKTTFSAVI